MIRKLLLVGMVMLVDRGSVGQLALASIIAFIFLSMHLLCWPYKRPSDNILRAATEGHIFLAVMLALVLKHDLHHEKVQASFYEHLLFWSFIAMVPFAFIFLVWFKLREIVPLLRQHEDKQGKEHNDAGSSIPDVVAARLHAFTMCKFGLADISQRKRLERWFKGWGVKKQYAVFISHYKDQAGAEARVLKQLLSRCLRTETEDQIFLDSDNLTNLSALRDHITQSDAVVVLLTKNFLSRPWCLVEMQTAVRERVPIIILPIKPSTHYLDPADEQEGIASILDNLPAWLRANNSQGGFGSDNAWYKTWQESFDLDVTTLGAELKDTLIAATRDARGNMLEPLNTQGSASQLHSRMGGLACTLVETASPDNASLVCLKSEQLVEFLAQRDVSAKWPVERRVGVQIIYQQRDSDALVSTAAAAIKQYLVSRTDLGPRQVYLRQDEGHEGEDGLTVAEVEDKLGANFPVLTQDADCVLLLQSRGVLRDPRAIASIYAAIEYQVPICCAFFTGNHAHLSYNFEEAFTTLQNLPSALERGNRDDLELLQQLIGQSDLATVGKQLLAVLPKIISKPLGLGGLAADGSFKESEMDDLVATLRGTHSDRLKARIHAPLGPTARRTRLMRASVGRQLSVQEQNEVEGLVVQRESKTSKARALLAKRPKSPDPALLPSPRLPRHQVSDTSPSSGDPDPLLLGLTMTQVSQRAARLSPLPGAAR